MLYFFMFQKFVNCMGQWLSWVKSNENEILQIIDDLGSKAVQTSEALNEYLDDLKECRKNGKS